MAHLKELYRKAISDQFPLGDSVIAKDVQGTNLYKLILAFAELFDLLHHRSNDLALEFFPSTASELADNWQEELFQGGLVSSCINQLSKTQQEQIRALIADAFANGGNRAEYYIKVAEKLGFSMEVIENSPTVFEAEMHIDSIYAPCDKFTKPIIGSSVSPTLTAVQKSLSELGVTINPSTRAVEIVFDANINDYKQVARYWDDGSVPTLTDGMPVFTGETLKFTEEQFNNLRLIAIDGNITLRIVQYEEEFRYVQVQTPCDFEPCRRLANHDLDADIHTLTCLLSAIMPAHLKFNIFVNGKLYDIVKPVSL